MNQSLMMSILINDLDNESINLPTFNVGIMSKIICEPFSGLLTSYRHCIQHFIDATNNNILLVVRNFSTLLYSTVVFIASLEIKGYKGGWNKGVCGVD